MKKKIFTIILYVFAVLGFVFSLVYIGMSFGIFNVRGSIAERNSFFKPLPKTDNVNDCLNQTAGSTNTATCDWVNTSEWSVVHDGLIKDKAIIIDVANKTGVSPRMIVSAVVPEQLRFFTSNRESFKRYFEPMKLLGSMSKFSLGVSGVKQDTANNIEKYASDKFSVFYPGEGFSDLLSYPENTNHDTELYNRLSDAHNHYYSYLYTALYLKEIQSQWKNAGFDVSERPDVLVTLFNLGFNASNPNSNPQVAGATISIGGKDYSFGALGTAFYNSQELRDVLYK